MVGKTIKLNSGYEVPLVGYGTWQATSPDQLKVGIRAAIEAGYRHIDTALMYGNESLIGEVLQELFDSGKLKREELFITTKNLGFYRTETLIKTLKSQLESLRVSYVDLYLLHFPTPLFEPDAPGQLAKMSTDGKIIFDLETKLEDAWHAMEKAVELGLARSIGISNFNISQTERMIKCGKIKPAVNQIEVTPGFHNKKLVDYCQSQGVAVTAYSQFGSPGSKNMVTGEDLFPTNFLEDEHIAAIAKQHGKSNAQVILRWLIQRGIMVIPKSVTPARIADNFNIWDFELSPEEMKAFDALDKNTRSLWVNYFGLENHPEYPHKEAGSC